MDPVSTWTAIKSFFAALPKLVEIGERIAKGFEDRAELKARIESMERREEQRGMILENLRIKTDQQAAEYAKRMADLEFRIGRK